MASEAGENSASQINRRQLRQPAEAGRARSGRNAFLVGAGIVLSRISGVVREGFLAAWLGTRSSADAFSAALRIPKLLQNLLGEGALSASFIPVYSQVLHRGDERRAGQVAGAVAGLLTLLTGGLVLLSVLLARPLAAVVAPGFSGQKHELTVYLIRIVAPGVGFLVLSAWCLGVLNSHRRFFLSYVVPVLWNTAIIVGLATAGIRAWAEPNIAEAAAWGVLIGGGLQFLIQLPAVRAVVPHLRITFSTRLQAVRTVSRRFLPAVAGRGVVTLGNYTDLILASLLATGAVAVLDRAQVLYLLPISVFAVSVAAADLPELSRSHADGAAPSSRQSASGQSVSGQTGLGQAGFGQNAGRPDHVSIARRLAHGSERVLLFLMFSTVAFIMLGGEIVAALYERANFTSDDTLIVWWVLAVYSVGLVASGLSRLLQNACYAAGDVAGPARISGIRLALSLAVGVILMFQLDRIAIDGGTLYRIGSLPAFTPLDAAERAGTELRHLGPIGLAAGSMLGASVELALLKLRVRRAIHHRVEFRRSVMRLLPATLLAAAIGGILVWWLGSLNAVLVAVLALAVSGFVYLMVANIAGHPVSRTLFRPLRRLIWGSPRQ